MYGLVDCNTEVFLIYNKSLLKIIDQILEEEYCLFCSNFNLAKSNYLRNTSFCSDIFVGNGADHEVGLHYDFSVLLIDSWMWLKWYKSILLSIKM